METRRKFLGSSRKLIGN